VLLGLDEIEQIGRSNLAWILANSGEERFQVERIGAHSIRARSRRGEGEEVIDERMTYYEGVGRITLTTEATDLGRPNHRDPPWLSSARRDLPRRFGSGGGSPG
jgi:hypothetical protein